MNTAALVGPEIASHELPFDRPAPLGESRPRLWVETRLPGDGATLADVAEDVGVPVAHVVLTAWAVVLATYSSRASLTMGVALRGTIVGLEINADARISFATLAARITDDLVIANSSPAFGPAVFVLDPGGGGIDHVAPATSMVLALGAADDAWMLAAGYDPGRFDESTARRVLDHVTTVLSSVAACGGGVPVGELEVVPAVELALLDEWNSNAVDFGGRATLVSLFRAAAARHADAVAVEFEGRRVSYAELAESARRVADRLAGLGVGRGSMVGVLCERSVELVAGLHGVVMAGAAYVPLDPDHPVERISHMVGETAMKVVLAQARFRGLVADPGIVLVDIDEVLAAGNGDDELVALPDVEPDDVAYVIYTSGSTGRPKGVANTHRAIVNRLLWMQDRFGLDSRDAVLQKTPFSFDVSVWEFFWPLQTGARLVVAEPGGHRDPAYLIQTIASKGVGTIHFVPSMLRLFLDHPAVSSCAALRRVICSGEALTRDVQDRFFAVLPGVELHNLYGPTEAAIDVTAWQCRPDDALAVVPIGAPIANTAIHILDDRRRRVPVGIPGELYIGGVQVAVGYVNRDDLTVERFVPDPFDPCGRLYKTGDLARWLPNGQVEFLGRLDTQVKLHGQRIELGEIEAALGEHPTILEAAVTVVESAGDATLVAHVMGRGETSPAADLRGYLERRLPIYMVPARFVVHDALPLTSSGKVDRKALSELSHPSEAHRSPTAGADELEQFLIDVWCAVLDRPDVGRADRVFDLGASSLQAAAFVNRVQRELDEFIYVVSVFLAPTVAEYAALLERDYADAVRRRFGASRRGRVVRATRIDDAAITRMREIVPTFGPHPSWRVGQPNPSAIFILSPPRSGTTLLRVMLAGHPRLFAASELQLLGFDTLGQRRAAFDGRFSPWREGTIRAVMELEGCDADVATRLMESHERDGLTCKEFYRWLQDRAGERVVVDKSPTYALDPDALRNAELGFDAPQYIHLVRDPLAMSRSFESYHMDQILFLHDHSWPGRALGELVWTLSHRNILQFAEEVPPERLLRVRFEDLVHNPRSVMTEMAAFLGLDFDEGLVRPYERLETKMVDGLHPESTPMGDTRLLERDRIDPDVVRRWARHGAGPPLGEPTLRLARRFGYNEYARSVGAGERRRFADSTRRRRDARRSGG
jgi:amino acid adenylation domain-containing protein